MNDRQKLHDIMQAMNLPKGQWALVGDAAKFVNDAMLNNIDAEDDDRSLSTIDILVTTATWFARYESTDLVWALGLPDPDETRIFADPPRLFMEFLEIEVNLMFTHIGSVLSSSQVISNAKQIELNDATYPISLAKSLPFNQYGSE